MLIFYWEKSLQLWKKIFQVSTSLFSTSKLPQTVDIETATKGVQLNADQLQSLKQSFVNANKPNSATPSIDSSANQEDLDSGIISSKPGAGLLWDKPYLSSLKESFEVNIDYNFCASILTPESKKNIKIRAFLRYDTNYVLGGIQQLRGPNFT